MVRSAAFPPPSFFLFPPFHESQSYQSISESAYNYKERQTRRNTATKKYESRTGAVDSVLLTIQARAKPY